jgi:predicted HicB family RNase H-like nuclease
MADQSRGKSPRRKPRPRADRKQGDGQSEPQRREPASRDSSRASGRDDDRDRDFEPADRTMREREAPSDEDFDEAELARDREMDEQAIETRDAQAPRNEPPRHNPGPRVMPEEEFAIQVFYDRGQQTYLATCLEFPDMKVQGGRREDVVEELSQKIGDELELMRRDGRQLPVPFSARSYPEKLEVRISKGLYRRLDMQSRQDRVPMDQLVSELLTHSLGRRVGDAGRGQGERRPQNQNQKNAGHGGGGHGNNRRGGGGGGGGRGQRDRNYHDTMGKTDNFLEYVRNLEKGGGYKKR